MSNFSSISWWIDYCSTQQAALKIYLVRKQSSIQRNDGCPLCTRPTCFYWIFKVLAHRDGPWVDISLHSWDTPSRFNVLAFIFECCVLGEQLLICLLTRSATDATNYSSRGEPANSYITDDRQNNEPLLLETLKLDKCQKD